MPNIRPIRVDFTSSAFAHRDGDDRLQRFVSACGECGFTPGIQLHNTIGSEMFAKALASTLPLSAHAPIFPENNLNLATLNAHSSFRVLDTNAALFCRVGIRMAVFHVFGMYDATLPGIRTKDDYTKVWRKIYRPELSVGGGAVQNRDYTSEPEFLERRDWLRNNLIKVRERYCHTTFCIENDLPVFGCSAMRAKDMIYLGNPICLDTGHLWATSLLLGFDFYAELEAFLASGLVKMIHLHNSSVLPDTPKNRIHDGHQKLASGVIDMSRVVPLLMRGGCDFIVLEIPDGDEQDVYELHRLMQS